MYVIEYKPVITPPLLVTKNYALLCLAQCASISNGNYCRQ